MKALLWKDLRAGRVMLASALAALVCVYVVGCLVNVYSQWRYGVPSMAWSHMMFTCAICSLLLELPAAAMLGGCSFAAERADRSAEFLAYMPVSRGKMAASKALLALGVLGAIWLLNLAVLWTVESHVGPPDTAGSLGRTTWGLVSICGCMFGVAWLCSAMAGSPALAACAGICVPVLLVVVAVFISKTLVVSESTLDRWFTCLCGSVGLAGFLLGWRYYVHGVEP